MTVNLSARFTKDTSIFDGLKNIQEKLVANPLESVVVVAVIRPKFTKVNHEDGTSSVTVRTTAIEPLFGDAAEQAKQLHTEAFKDRTGRDDDPTDPSLFDHFADGDDDGDE